MAQQQANNERDVITVKWTGMTYKARIDCESTTCTAGPELAARRLAARVMDVPFSQAAIKELARTEDGQYRYQITNLNGG